MNRQTGARALLPLLLLLIALVARPISGQAASVTLDVEPGYAGAFREGYWLPVLIHAANAGDTVSGRLVVRPETSGAGIPNTYSVPVTLAGGARQTIPLAINAAASAQQIRVELLDEDGVVLAQQSARLSPVMPADRLYAVVNESPSGAPDLTDARFGNNRAVQALLDTVDLPAQSELLRALDLLLISDADTTAISSAQREALRGWVTQGGHLVVSGGANWQATTAGVLDLLPIAPTGSQTADTLAPLADWLALPDDAVQELADTQTVVTTGALTTDAQVLAALDDGTPLIARRALGAGTVDFIAADVSAQPLSGWSRAADLWLALQTTRAPQPGWSHGFGNFDQANRALDLLPGLDPLPDALLLLGFLALYIAVIGPLNYFILRRINRLEWAWGTIPLCMIAFTLAAWGLGYAVRGNDAILNRLALVQAFDGQARAQTDGLVGVYSPGRRSYTLTAGDDLLLRPIPDTQSAGSLLSRGAAGSVEIVQDGAHTAEDFPVDASYVFGFALNGQVDPPGVTGEVSLRYDPQIPGQMLVRGSITNDGDRPLQDPVILARGAALHLGETLEPGDLATFELVLPGEGHPASSPHVPTSAAPFFAYAASDAETSVIDLIGPERYDDRPTLLAVNIPPELQALRRDQLLLWSLVDDSFGSTGRGDSVYVGGWMDDAAPDVTLEGADWSDQQSTYVVTKLNSAVEAPAGSVTIAPDRFTWAVIEHDGPGGIAPVDLRMTPGETVSFRFTPLADAVLDDVESMTIGLDDASIVSQRLPVSLWNWREESWDEMLLTRDGLRLELPDAYLGPQNAVQVRLVADDIGGYLRIGSLTIEQTGRFAPDDAA